MKFIDWTKSIGLYVPFEYDEISGNIKILDYNNKTCYLKVQYKDNIFNITGKHFTECKIGNLIGKKTTKYFYNIGENINNLEILEQIKYGNGKYKQRGYKYKCLKDGYVNTIDETSLKNGVGCPVCSNNIVVNGINDFATTHPELLKFLVNKEDAYTHTYGSSDILQLKCPDCGCIKYSTFAILSKNYFRCPKCGDGVSYPEKFIFSFLEQLNINFECQKSFTWSSKIYDFYIPSINGIIETHGLQHYKTTGGVFEDVVKTHKNDNKKEKLAKQNGIEKYIVLDCSKSNKDKIIQTIYESELCKLYDISNVNWVICDKNASISRIKNACDLWNNKIEDVIEISKILKLNPATIRTYLHKGTELGLCNYDGRSIMAKSVFKRKENKKC